MTATHTCDWCSDLATHITHHERRNTGHLEAYWCDRHYAECRRPESPPCADPGNPPDPAAISADDLSKELLNDSERALLRDIFGMVDETMAIIDRPPGDPR